MESSEEPTSLQSICQLRASELYPKASSYECEDNTLAIPFIPIFGESVVALGRIIDGILALSNYRLFLKTRTVCKNIPVGVIETVEVKEMFFLHIVCKDARSFSCSFATNEHCLEWYKRIHKAITPRKSIEDVFAFAYYAWFKEEGKNYPRLAKETTLYLTTFNAEVNRMKFDLNGSWRISPINKDYKICQSYPPQLLVPACISDEVLELVSKFRSSRRIPAVVWRNVKNGAVIARSSQPEVGWLGWRSKEDEDLLKALSDACSFDSGDSITDSSINYPEAGEETAPTNTITPKKVLIVDARSYTTAVANRARGGGCECPEYYPSCEIQFMNLANIHTIRKSFHAVRQLCASDAEQPNYLSLLDGTRWLQHMAVLLQAAVTVASAIENDGRPVLVHCSDGWDRTPQIVALAQILLDPYYRTMEGFKILCEREWLDFGHKFADRCGQSVGGEDPNERCPVFLQWLDCIHQIIQQFPCSFQMSHAYFVKLAQHTYSLLFGTFLCNTREERLRERIQERTYSVWHFLNSNSFINHLYSPSKDEVLWPNCNVRDLSLWSEVYLGSLETSLGVSDIKQRMTMIGSENEESDEPLEQMIKTRSYGDLVHPQDYLHPHHRRLSDPSISIEKKFDNMNLENELQKDEVVVNEKLDEKVEEEKEKKVDDKRKAFSDKKELNELPINTSDSSTDTLIPNNDLTIICKKNGEVEELKTSPTQSAEQRLVEAGTSKGYCPCNHVQAESSDFSEMSAPLTSRSPTCVCPPSPNHQEVITNNPERLDDVDGLPLIHCDIQLRVQQIIVEHKLKEEALRKELRTNRLALIKQVCNHTADSDRIDDIGSLPDSVGSAGDHGESIPSDMSWEAVEELAPAPTLWVPDHAVDCCMGCGIEFWLGRRRHHCRSCGRVFCADCSENTTPLPSEQLYNPVRVCSDCFCRLHHRTSPCSCNIQENKVENDVDSESNFEGAATCQRAAKASSQGDETQ